MGLAGDAPWALGIMWFLTALVFFFLMLRLYTRLFCLASYGIDDHIYAVAFVSGFPPVYLEASDGLLPFEEIIDAY